jgi:hypothetical protein
VSRKFVYAQQGKASDALDDAFCAAVPDDEVLFQLPVTRSWLRQVMLGLPLICRSGTVTLLACCCKCSEAAHAATQKQRTHTRRAKWQSSFAS